MTFKPVEAYLIYSTEKSNLYISILSLNGSISRQARMYRQLSISDSLAFKVAIHIAYRFLSERSEQYVHAEPFWDGHERLYKKLGMKYLKDDAEMSGNRLEVLKALAHRYPHIVNDIALYSQYYLIGQNDEYARY